MTKKGLMLACIAAVMLGGCGGGAPYEVLAENPPGAEGQEGIAGLQIETEADSEAELLEVARQIADDYENDGADGIVMSFQEPGQEQAELGLGYVAYNESGRERLAPATELMGAPLDEEGVSVSYGGPEQ